MAKGGYKSYVGINYIRRNGMILDLYSTHTTKQEAQARAKSAKKFYGNVRVAKDKAGKWGVWVRGYAKGSVSRRAR